MEQPANTEDKRHISLLELPQDVLQAICQHLFQARDLARLASCNRACQDIANRPALWEYLLVTRFGEDPVHISSLNSTAVKALYVKKSRTTVPAVQLGAVHLGTRAQYLVHEDMINSTFGRILVLKNVCWLDINASFHGVLPGEYQIVWRMMKVSTGNVGWGNSPVTMSVDTHAVHPTETYLERDSTSSHMARGMQQFNHLPPHEWVDIPGGSIHIHDFSDVSVRLWCHSGDWKSGLAWDYVKLKDLNQPEAVEPRLQHARPLSDSVATAASSLVHRVQTAADDCNIQ